MLHAPLKVNGRAFAEVEIVRLDRFRGADYPYTYTARLKGRALLTEAGHFEGHLSEDVKFVHTYADGALVCLVKAIEALRGAGIDLSAPEDPVSRPSA